MIAMALYGARAVSAQGVTPEPTPITPAYMLRGTIGDYRSSLLHSSEGLGFFPENLNRLDLGGEVFHDLNYRYADNLSGAVVEVQEVGDSVWASARSGIAEP